MQWIGRRQSSNVEDQRGSGGGRQGFVLGGVGTIAIVLIGLLIGKNPMELLEMVNQNQGSQNDTDSTTYQPGRG